MSEVAQLGELDDAILALAGNPPGTPGDVDNRIRELGMTPIAFYQRLNQLIDTEAALSAYPVVVNRLRRLRSAGRRR